MDRPDSRKHEGIPLAAGFVSPLGVTLCGLFASLSAFAQPREDPSHFEVASVKPADHKAPNSCTGPYTGDLGRLLRELGAPLEK
jgi:hypothetical protein